MAADARQGRGVSMVRVDPDFDLAQVLRPGAVVTWPQAAGEPLGLTAQLVVRRHELPPVGLFIGMSTSNTLLPEHADRLTMRGLNGAGTNRRIASAGVLDIIPAPVSAVPGLLRSGAIKVDVAFIRARVHPQTGYVTAGVVADFIQAMVEAAGCVVAELDDRLPLTGQDALIPIGAIDHFITATGPEMLLPDPQPTPIDTLVAAQVAAFIPDRATVQLGIGSLPVAVARALSGHRDLGIHTGVVSDVLVDLVESGVVTNAWKGIDVGVSVTGGLSGTRRLLDFADSNPALSMRSSDYTHRIETMARVMNLYSVNGAIEVDLTGQVNAELAGGRYLGAVGGQLDFVRGAQASPGGRSIIALPSTTPDGRHSRVVRSLAGRPVTTPRSDVDVIITEYGVADLRGCSFSERARRLAAIAHPDFRDELLAPERLAKPLREDGAG
jgi:acetyl-CoA hydrolase